MSKKTAKVTFNEEKRQEFVRSIARQFTQGSIISYEKMFPIIKEETGEQITSLYFNSLKTIMLRYLIRYVQRLLINTYQKQIVRFGSRQVSNTRTSLLRCRDWMEKKDQETMFKCIKNCMLREKLQVTEDQVTSFYEILCKLGWKRQIRDRVVRVKKGQRQRELAEEQLLRLKQQLTNSQSACPEEGRAGGMEEEATRIYYSISSDQ